MAASFFLGLAYTLRTGGHVRVSLVAEQLPPNAACLLDIVATLVAIWFSAFIIYAMAQFALASYAGCSVSFTATSTPPATPQSVVPLGVVLPHLQLAVPSLLLEVVRTPPAPT